jgi:hypothetical protein
LAVVFVASVSGVGAAAGAPLTKQQYVAAYNALCDASIAKAQAAIHALSKNHTSSEFVGAIAPIYQHRLDQSRKLAPPQRDRKRVKALLVAQQDALNTAKNDGNTLLVGGNGGVGPKPKSDKLAKTYGLESGTCVNPSDQQPLGNGPAQTPPSNGTPGPSGTMPCPGVGPCAGNTGTQAPPARS